jgi:hypothetical protein
MTPRAVLTTVIVSLVAVAPPRPGRAELLYFVNGGSVQCPATVHDDRVVIQTMIGDFPFLLKDFLKIAPGGCPEREWPTRRSEALKGDSALRFSAAWWALENGLVPEAVEMLRLSHARDSHHQPTRRLVKVLDDLQNPLDDPSTDRLHRALGVSCETLTGQHIVLLHQHPAADAQIRLDLLERIVIAYYLVLTAHGIDLEIPSQRLVCVYLKNQSDYLAFIRSQNAGAFQSTLGFFHPTYRAVIAYDVRSNRRTRSIKEPRDSNTLATPSDASPSADPDRRELLRRQLLASLDALARDHGTAAHEMIHLLVAESRLEPSPGAFPHWLHEGLAAQFEVVRSGRWAGVGRAHDLRLTDFRVVSASPDLASLIRDKGFGRGYRGDLYARSWALVYYLRKTRPQEFHAFLDLLRLPNPDSDPTDSSRFEQPFRAAFGPDLARLEAAWPLFMNKVHTPLEDATPPRLSVGNSRAGHRD